MKSGRYHATTDFDGLRDCDAIAIYVPTPLGAHREPDNSFIHATGQEIAKRLRKGQLVILESTTYPGTTDEELLPILEKSGLKCGPDFFLAFSPEREDPDRKDFDTTTTAKVVGGVDAASTELAVALSQTGVAKVVPVSSARVAESAKLLENVFRSVNIALVNELKTFFDRMDIDILEVIEVAKDAATWGGYDAVVISTAHEIFKDPALFQGLQLVVDTRNLVSGQFPGGDGPKRVVKAQGIRRGRCLTSGASAH